MTKNEWIKRNLITKKFSRDEVEALERIEKHIPDSTQDNESESNFPWGCSDVLKKYIIEQEEKMKKIWEKNVIDSQNKMQLISKEIENTKTLKELEDWKKTKGSVYIKEQSTLAHKIRKVCETHEKKIHADQWNQGG